MSWKTWSIHLCMVILDTKQFQMPIDNANNDSHVIWMNRSYFSVQDWNISVSSFVEVFCVGLFTFQPSVIQRHGWLSSTLLLALCVKYASASDRLHFFQTLGKWASDEIWRLLHYTQPAPSLLPRCCPTASAAHHWKDGPCKILERVNQKCIFSFFWI